ncbi:MAG TPA: hypothetical protein VMS40_01350 [Vicinamibacterales bacterium]|nr:hypothetical protein [Vicinamibacterales bacterium]
MHARGMAVVLATIVGIGLSTWVRAQSETGPAATVNDAASGTDDVHAAGRTVHIQNEVAGDVAAAGAEVTIDGPVNGYVMSAGRSVTLDGRVGNDVWAAGETVTVDSPVGNNAMIAGRNVSLGRNAVIGHDARLAGNTVTAEGRVERNLDIGAETARIGADIGGTVSARADRVSVLPGAVIRGDLVVRANQPPEISPQAQVMGQVRFEDATRSRWIAWPGQWLFLFLGLLILGLAALAFAPAWPVRVAGTMRTQTRASILSGLFMLVVIPIAIASLAVTLIGIPLAIVMFAFYVATLLLAGVFVSYRTGDWLVERLHRMQTSLWVRMILGVMVVSFVMSLPTVGLIFTAMVMVVGAGALVLERRSQRMHAHT